MQEIVLIVDNQRLYNSMKFYSFKNEERLSHLFSKSIIYFRPNIVITLSLLLAAVATQLLVLTQDIYLFCALVVISGAAQAPIWPACIKALSSHIGENSIGTYVGLLG